MAKINSVGRVATDGHETSAWYSAVLPQDLIRLSLSPAVESLRAIYTCQHKRAEGDDAERQTNPSSRRSPLAWKRSPVCDLVVVRCKGVCVDRSAPRRAY